MHIWAKLDEGKVSRKVGKLVFYACTEGQIRYFQHCNVKNTDTECETKADPIKILKITIILT